MAETALLEASKAGDVETVRTLLLTGDVDVNACVGWNQRPALHLASRWGHVHVVDLLLAAGADPNIADLDGFTPLILAASYNQPRVIERLLEAHADRTAATEYGRTPLHSAAKKGHVQCVKVLLRENGDPDVAPQNGHTALHEACLYLQSDAARVLLELGANLHAKDHHGYEPLHRCILRRKFVAIDKTLETLQVLVLYGATWDAQCDELVTMGKASKEAPALRVCVLVWAQEHADDLPLTQISVESIQRGPEDTRIYLHELKTSKTKTLRRKICVVGPSKAGKTSLIKSLTSKQPSLEHADDRTIGIDHIHLRFGVQTNDKTKIHEVTFWDFAGQDEYHVAHSLFFSPRTLYLVCVDLEAFLVAFMQADLMANTPAQRQQLLNEFVELYVLRWVRTIFSQQPDAEFVFVATKSDTLNDFPEFAETVKASLRSKLAQVEGIVMEMKRELMKIALEGERSADTLTLHAYQKRVVRREVVEEDDEPVTTLLDKTGTGLHTKFFNYVTSMINNPTSAPPQAPRALKWETLFVSCEDAASVANARKNVIDLIVQSDRSFEMPDSYTTVLNAVVAMRSATTGGDSDRRVAQAFAPIDPLVKTLLTKTTNVQQPQKSKTTDVSKAKHRLTIKTVDDGLGEATCRSILKTLHDLGDVLWYQDLGVELFAKTVILDPLLLIDFVRQVINHHQKSETLAHAELQALPYWHNLRSQEQVLALKLVLQKFQLVHPSDGDMKWNSDLIVPSFWKSKTPASWLFGYEDVRLVSSVRCDDPQKRAEQLRVHWQYQFMHEFPDALFDHLVVATYSPFMERDAGPDWILYAEDGVFACRAMVARNSTTLQRVLHLEAVLADDAAAGASSELWEAFECLSEGVVQVLRRYPGLVVTSVALDERNKMVDLESLVAFPLKVRSRKWMPRIESWERYKRVLQPVNGSE